MTRFLIAAALVLLIGYGFIEVWPLVAGPSFTISSPTPDASYPDGIVDIRGTSARVALLTLDGTPVLRDQKGDFQSTLTFPRGGSILTFVATDRFGRSVTETRAVYVPN